MGKERNVVDKIPQLVKTNGGEDKIVRSKFGGDLFGKTDASEQNTRGAAV